LSAEDFVCILPSGLRPVKNIDLALDGLEIVHDKFPRLRLLLVGTPIDHRYTAHIRRRLSQLKWARYLGEVPHGKMAGVLQLADIVLNTSLAEGQPQGALEAMSLGKPCILTAVPGNLGIIKEGYHGYYVDSAFALAEAAGKLVQDPFLKETLGEAARQLVEEKYSAASELDAYSGLYQSLSAQAAGS
jgi:glycosyltransferase involved in cell wall biosynthesis